MVNKVPANLKFDAVREDNTVIVKAKLDKIPRDLEDLASMQIEYSFDKAMLTYAKTEVAQEFNGANVNTGRFVWNGTVDELPADGVLFPVLSAGH